ncbi:MAG: hypothetical protein RI573_07040 [Balneolaceae bacterium]|nr:hypothetical protein [Balneolaceae bacterium]
MLNRFREQLKKIRSSCPQNDSFYQPDRRKSLADEQVRKEIRSKTLTSVEQINRDLLRSYLLEAKLIDEQF